MTTRPTLADSVAGHHAKELAALADSIAERADALAERLQRSSSSTAEERNGFTRQAGYAEGVRDVLNWLAGDRPADLLTDVLDVDPED